MHQAASVAGMRVETGAKSRASVRTIELPDGAIVNIDVVMIRGMKPGPTLYVGAGMHGDEATAVKIVAEVAGRLNPRHLSGTVLAVPVQNPLCFRDFHRLPLGQVIRSPLDQMPADMMVSFPGDPEGNPIKRMTHILFSEVMSKADCVIDIHTPTTGGRYAPMAFIPPSRIGKAAERAEQLAKVFGVSYILKTEPDCYAAIYVNDKSPHVVMAARGIPGFGVELGEGGRLEGELVERGVEGVFNILGALKMAGGKPHTPRRHTIMTDMVPVRARIGGLLETLVKLEQKVSKGDALAQVISPYGEVIEVIEAPLNGVLIRKTTFPTVCTGERVAQIAVL